MAFGNPGRREHKGRKGTSPAVRFWLFRGATPAGIQQCKSVRAWLWLQVKQDPALWPGKHLLGWNSNHRREEGEQWHGGRAVGEKIQTFQGLIQSSHWVSDSHDWGQRALDQTQEGSFKLSKARIFNLWLVNWWWVTIRTNELRNHNKNLQKRLKFTKGSQEMNSIWKPWEICKTEKVNSCHVLMEKKPDNEVNVQKQGGIPQYRSAPLHCRTRYQSRDGALLWSVYVCIHIYI